MIKNYIKIMVAILVVVALGFVLKRVTTKPTSEKMRDFLLNQGYVANEDKTLYEKQTSELAYEDFKYYASKNIASTYSIASFDIYGFQLIKNIEEYENKIYSSLSETFDYKDNSLVYTYRITGNDVNVIFKGEYDIETKKMSCEKEFSYGVNTQTAKETICNKVELSVARFSLEAQTLFPNADFIQYMKSQKKD